MPTKPRAAPPETRTLFARIPADQYRRLKLLAVHREVRIAALVSEALDKYLSEEGRRLVKAVALSREERLALTKMIAARLKKGGHRHGRHQEG